MTNKFIKEMAEIISDYDNKQDRQERIEAFGMTMFLYGLAETKIETPEGNFYEYQLEVKGSTIL